MISEMGFIKRKHPGARKIIYLMVFLCALFYSCLFSASALAGEGTGPEQIILTCTRNPATSQTITWLTPNNDSSLVQYAVAEGFNGDFDAAGQMAAAVKSFAGSDNYHYTVTLTGLKPGTQYFYRVGKDGAWSEPLSFSTSAAPQDFTFLYLGDVQDGYAQWGNLLDEIYRENPQIRFALLGGDLTDNGSDQHEWGEFLDAATGVFSRIPMMPAKGNHDGSLFSEFFSLPDNGPQGVSGTFYSFDYGDAHFVVLDTSNIITESVKQWLQEDLEETSKKWNFAVFHIPAYPVVYDYKGIDQTLCEHWVPILEANGVDMVFVGHQHVYMRTHPIFQGEVQSGAYGIVYVMGNSGSKFYDTAEGFPYIAREETGSNYQLLELNGNVLTLTAKKAGGELIETYALSKGETHDPGQNPLYTVTPGTDQAYTPGSTGEGICTMTVNYGVSGFNYFTAGINPLVPHNGEETVVFTHSRNGSRLGLNATRADFDQVDTAQAGFNVKAGDVIKVYIVDELTSANDHNPVILQ
jgi:hypothetical protein